MRLYLKLSVIPALVLLLASGASNAAASEPVWTMFKGDAQHTGQSAFEGSEVNTLRWHFSTEARISSSPTIGPDGTVYVGSYDSKLYAINPDGTRKWRFSAQEIIDSTPAIAADGTIYFASWDRKVYAIEPNGRALWTAETNDRISSSPTIGPDGTIYIGADNGILYAIKSSGSLRWRFATGDRIFSSPAVATDGTVYVGSFDLNLYAVNPDGTVKWRFPTGGFIFSSPSIAPDGTVYVGSYDGNLYAINPDGTEKWRFETGEAVQGSPSIAPDGTVYVGSLDNNMYAINPDGTEKWRFPTEDLVVSSAVIDSDGTIYFGSVDMNLYSINPDGTLKWRFETDARIFSTPSIAPDGTVYVGSVDGNLYAIGEQLIDPRSKFPIDGSLKESVGYAGTELYVSDAVTESLDGSNTVTIDVLLKNQGTLARTFDPASFKIKDLDGNEYEADISKSTLKSVRVQSGDILRGTVNFEVTSERPVDLLLYQDVRGASLNIDLTDVKVPPDALPAGISNPGSNIGKKLIGDRLELTILDEVFEPDEDRYVVELSLRNIGGGEVNYDQAHAYVKDAAGNAYTATEGSFAGTLQSRQSATGEIAFTVAGNIKSVIFVYDDATTDAFMVPEFPAPFLTMLITVSVSVFVTLLATRFRIR